MQLQDVYDTKTGIAITQGNDIQDPSLKYREIALSFFKKIKTLPTKYDLHLAVQYIIPREILAHTKEYSKETVFPRMRVLPEEAVKTKWELFAERKGIVKNRNKNGGRIYNEETREYTPAFGRGSKNDLDKNWLIEIKEHEDPMVDRHAELKERKVKNKRNQKLKEYRNQKRTDKIKFFQRRDIKN